MDDAGNDWDRLARVASSWRENDLLDSQLTVATRGGLSLDRVQALEAGRALGARGTTLAKFEKGLRWTPGSARDVLRGGNFTPLPDVPRPAAPAAVVEDLAPDEQKAVELLRTVRDLFGPDAFRRAAQRVQEEGSPNQTGPA